MTSSFLNRPEVADRAALIAQALAHPIRLQILEILGRDGAYFMHIANMLGRPQANLSQHLMVLREAGLVQAEREGMTVFYRLSASGLMSLLDSLYGIGDRAALEVEFPQHWERHRGRRGRGSCHCPRCQP
jgi:ArsR family transcriptional regulator